MGNHRFRFSDMMPNAWFYKLKDMGKSTSKLAAASPVPFVPKRASYYFPSDSPSHPKANDTPFPLRSPFDIEHKLRPVLTKPVKKVVEADEERVRTVKKRARRRGSSPRVRVSRARGGASRGRRGLGESFAVVKCSSDPRRDFRESMREMIAENGLTASRDLEELLAWYLSLNSDEYHAVIVKVFEEVWFDVANLVSK